MANNRGSGMRKGYSDIFVSVGIFAFLTSFLLQVKEIPDEAKYYPSIILYISYFLAAVYLIRSIIFTIRKDNSEASTKKNNFKIFFTYSLLILLYIVVIPVLGYVVSTLVFSVLSLVMLQNKSKKLLVLLPVILTALLYLMFVFLLGINLPSGLLV